jgi:hypothetical protein
MLNIYVGWDSREDIAYQVCKYSILKRATIPVNVIPLKQNELRELGIYNRPIDALASTEFTFTRFFVPYLNQFTGLSIFCDCDFLWLCDAKELLDLFDPRYAVQVVRHNYEPKEGIKMDQKVQHLYPRKNWSSLIMFNNEHPSNMVLTPQFLNQAHGSVLHQFKWLKDQDLLGLHHKYNWLEGWYKEPISGSPSIIHYTRGNVYFDGFQDVDFADLWKKEFKEYSGLDWNDDMVLDKK